MECIDDCYQCVKKTCGMYKRLNTLVDPMTMTHTHLSVRKEKNHIKTQCNAHEGKFQ